MSERVDNYFEQGIAELDAGNYETAIGLFDKAIRLSLGDIAEIYLYRGEAFAFLEEWTEALKSFNHALHRDPYMANAYHERGNVRRFMGDLQGALEDYGYALRINPQLYDVYFNRALTYEALGELSQAESDFTQVIQLNSGIALAYEGRGRIRAEQANYDLAIEDLQRYLRMGAGREYDNQSDVQAMILSLRGKRLLRRVFRFGRQD